MNSSALVRLTLPALMVLSACQTWSATHGQPVETIASPNSERVHIITSTGRNVVLRGVRVVDDSVIGVNDQNGDRIAVLGSQVLSAETKRVDPLKTTILTFTFFLIGIGGALIAVSYAQSGPRS